MVSPMLKLKETVLILLLISRKQPFNGAIVFVIDIFDIFSDITEPDAVKVTIDNLEIL